MTTHPFEISMAENEKMGCYDVFLQIGNVRTKEAAEHIAKLLSEFMIEGDRDGWAYRVQ